MLVDGKPRLLFLAKCDIAAGTEIVLDYGDRSGKAVKAHPWLNG